MNFLNVLNLFFPKKCGVCGKIGVEICNNCKMELKKLEINKIQNVFIENNKKIKVKKMYLYKYEGIIRKLLINYKFNDNAYLADVFVNLIKNNKKMFGILKSYDIIISVPLHKKRKLERGYNQTELIANKLWLKVERNCLIKIKNIKPQSEKSADSRKSDIKNVYKLENIEKIRGKKVLILDDIYTTGSTANECIKTVSQVTNKIGFISIAKDYLKINIKRKEEKNG